MYLRAVGRRFTQVNAYFLVMNSKRCSKFNVVNRVRSPGVSDSVQGSLLSFKLVFLLFSLKLKTLTVRFSIRTRV